mmetsp:Transcript_34967/g.87034  ORF Transcript_34967/g.87034 Transcript_34967/m.87034 type:complete len:316 (-) Transcript_34967:169-1116(-)
MNCPPLPANAVEVYGIGGFPNLPPNTNLTMGVWARMDGVSANIVRLKVWDREKTVSLLSDLKELHGKLGRRVRFLDVGANIGWFTVIAAASGLAEVIAVEADEKNAQVLRRNLCVNGLSDAVTLHTVGLGASEDECLLVARKHNAGSGSAICKGLMGKHASPAMVMNSWAKTSGLPFHDFFVSGSMRIMRLDDLGVGHADVMKIDVEGNEMEVAKGWNSLFEAGCKPRVIYSEYVPSLISVKSNSSLAAREYLYFFLRRGYSINIEANNKQQAQLSTAADVENWSGKYWLYEMEIRTKSVGRRDCRANMKPSERG